MDNEVKDPGQAGNSGTDGKELVPGQAGDPGTGGTGNGEGVKQPYTPEELEGLHPMEVDEERLNLEDPAHRAVLKSSEEYKKLQSHSTETSEELARMREKPPEPERYFDDPTLNDAFKDYLKDPDGTVDNINNEIIRLSGIPEKIEDEPNPEYTKSKRQIAYLEGTLRKFDRKEKSISKAKTDADLADARIDAEFGDNAKEIRAYAKTLGISNVELRKPELRKAVVNMFNKSSASRRADGKAAKPKVPATAGPGGPGGGIIKQKPITEVKDPNEFAERRGYGKDPDRQFI